MHRNTDDAGTDASPDDRVLRLLSQIEEPDFDRLRPPADLWDRIDASIKAEPVVSPKVPPVHNPHAGMVVEYWIDANDNVIDVGTNWADFAHDNDAPELVAPASDRTLWTYFGSDEIRELWQLLVERVRVLRTAAKVPLRCDAPHARRWFEMTITPESGGAVHFHSALVFEEARSAISILDPHLERDEGLSPVVLCSWCGRGRHDSLWLDMEALVKKVRLLEATTMPPISYGICGSCRDEMSAELLVPSSAGESAP